MHLQSDKTIENIDQVEIASLNFPACIMKNNDTGYVIIEANNLFIDLLKKNRKEIIGMGIDEVFPVTLENKNPPHKNSLIEGLNEATLIKRKIQVPIEHYILKIDDDKIFEINKWAVSVTPYFNPDDLSVKQLLITVFEV